MTTAREFIQDAYEELNVVAEDDPMTAEQEARGLRVLKRMLRAWANPPYGVFRKASMSVTLTTAASYVLTGRPMRLLDVRLKRGDIETPMQEFTRSEYDTLPLKTSTGLPTCYHYDKQDTVGTLYIWPLLAAADGETLAITYERAFDLPTHAGEDVDVPPEWGEAVMYGLASRLGGPHEKADERVDMLAAIKLRDAMNADIEGSVFFGCG